MAINQLPYQGVVAPRDLDFSSLAQLPQQYRQAQARQTLANLQRGPDGQVDTAPLYASGDLSLANLAKEIDRNKVMDGRDSRNFQFQQQEAQRAQQNADRSFSQQSQYQNRSLGIQEAAAKRKDRTIADDATEREAVAIRLGMERGSPSFNSYVATGKTGRDEGLTAGDRKVINSAEDELPNIVGTVDALKIAKDLNTKAFSGVTAGARAFIGSNVPGGGMVVDKAGADATTEWQKIMAPEALKVMADTLKGATTDFELRKFIEMLADPTTKPEIRGRVIDRMITLADRKKDLAERRINELRSGTYYKPGNTGRTTGPTSPTREIPQRAIEALRADPNLKADFEAKYGAGTAGAVLR
jgi:hypothetical protein